MDHSRRNQLARQLALVDQDLALAEEMVAVPQDNEDLQSAEELLLEFLEAKRLLEMELSDQ
jgi:hypothetical protein